MGEVGWCPRKWVTPLPASCGRQGHIVGQRKGQVPHQTPGLTSWSWLLGCVSWGPGRAPVGVCSANAWRGGSRPAQGQEDTEAEGQVTTLHRAPGQHQRAPRQGWLLGTCSTHLPVPFSAEQVVCGGNVLQLWGKKSHTSTGPLPLPLQAWPPWQGCPLTGAGPFFSHLPRSVSSSRYHMAPVTVPWPWPPSPSRAAGHGQLATTPAHHTRAE